MRVVLGLLLALVATGAQAQTGWDPPMGQPVNLRYARVIAPDGKPVPIFRDGTAAADAWFAGGMIGDEFSEPTRAKAACFAPHEAKLTVSRLFRDGDKTLFATVLLDGRSNCAGVIFYRHLRLAGL